MDNEGELHNDLSLWFHAPSDSDSVCMSVSVWLRRLGNWCFGAAGALHTHSQCAARALAPCCHCCRRCCRPRRHPTGSSAWQRDAQSHCRLRWNGLWHMCVNWCAPSWWLICPHRSLCHRMQPPDCHRRWAHNRCPWSVGPWGQWRRQWWPWLPGRWCSARISWTTTDHSPPSCPAEKR